MKALLFITALALSGSQLCFAQEISKADIIKTVRHIQALSAQQQIDLAKAQADYEAQGAALQKVTESANRWRVAAHDNAKQRDVLVYLVAILSGFWFLSRYRDFQLPLAPPWKWLIELGFFAAGFAGAYTFGRILLVYLSHFIP